MLVKSIYQAVNIAWSSHRHCQTSSHLTHCPPPSYTYYLGEGGEGGEGGGGNIKSKL